MPSFDPKIDEAFREYAKLELRCHLILSAGQEDSPDLADVEEQMTLLWEKLDEDQRQCLNGMASDLNWIRRHFEPPPKGRKTPNEVSEDDQRELRSAVGVNWHKFLHFLRLCAPLSSPDMLAVLRARAYTAADMPEIGGIFYEQVIKLAPGSSDLGLEALTHIKAANPERLSELAEEIVSSPLRYAPAMVAIAVQELLNRYDLDVPTTDRDRYLVLLNDVFSRLPFEPPGPDKMLVYREMAFAYSLLRDEVKGHACIEEALKIAPENEDLRILKGMSLYESDTDEAVAIFQDLTQKKTDDVHPYLFLAHYHLTRKNFGLSLEMSRNAWSKTADNLVRARLLEWQTISLEQAATLDPSDERIKLNVAVLINSVQNAKKSDWRIEDPNRLTSNGFGFVRTQPPVPVS